jgi:long-subunit fatty acid transport protein
MNKRILFALSAALALPVMAQTAIDAYQLSRYDLRGTARFMSMGGAFGALGGDLSTLNQNPGGIGVYRKSEIGFTLDIDMQSTQTKSTIDKIKESQTKVGVNNFGYVGSAYTGSDIMPFFNWGFSYGRVNSFNRRYRGSVDMNGSLSNYIAGFTTADGWDSGYLESSEANYWDRNHAPWLSLLAYNSFMINPVGGTTNQYNGLWKNGATYGVSDFDVEEKGFVDEYEINLGGNFNDIVYWGIGVGITDIDYQQAVYYEEYLNNACIPVIDQGGNVVAGQPQQTPGDVGFGLDSYKHINGTGVNVKAGLIVKPINELRLGFAVHSPTYYNLNQSNDGIVDYGYGYNTDPLKPGYTESPIESYSWKFRTPWRMMVSAAAVLGSSAIVSVDYEYRPYQNMVTKFADGDDCNDVNGDIKNYYKAANIIRLGAEYRVTPNFSVRAGYAYESTPTGAEVRNDEMMVYTSSPYDTGTTPSYTLDNSTQYITCGLGYRYKNFYADAAYVHKSRTSEFHPYTGSNGYTANPYTAEVKDNNNSIVLSLGFKF